MSIQKPIFIIGTGRSGTTIFYRMLSEHPNLAWLSSRLTQQLPGNAAAYHTLMRAVDAPLVGNFIRNRYMPSEVYEFWDRTFPGFSEPCRDLLYSDASIRMKKSIPASFSPILTAKRNRLLVKITGWPRTGFLRAIFPDAKFIHVYRDPRSVVNSLLNIYFWSGWQGPSRWRWGELTAEQNEAWHRFDRSFVALACIQMQILEEAFAKARMQLNSTNLHEIAYTDYCDDPIGRMQAVAEFCELPWTAAFEQKLRAYTVRSTNEKWQQDMTDEQQAIVEHFFPSQGSMSTVNGATVNSIHAAPVTA